MRRKRVPAASLAIRKVLPDLLPALSIRQRVFPSQRADDVTSIGRKLVRRQGNGRGIGECQPRCLALGLRHACPARDKSLGACSVITGATQKPSQVLVQVCGRQLLSQRNVCSKVRRVIAWRGRPGQHVAGHVGDAVPEPGTHRLAIRRSSRLVWSVLTVFVQVAIRINRVDRLISLVFTMHPGAHLIAICDALSAQTVRHTSIGQEIGSIASVDKNVCCVGISRRRHTADLGATPCDLALQLAKHSNGLVALHAHKLLAELDRDVGLDRKQLIECHHRIARREAPAQAIIGVAGTTAEDIGKFLDRPPPIAGRHGVSNTETTGQHAADLRGICRNDHRFTGTSQHDGREYALRRCPPDKCICGCSHLSPLDRSEESLHRGVHRQHLYRVQGLSELSRPNGPRVEARCAC
ncbi:hypothetical protein COAQ111491_22225 [Comamonas aquatilis]